MHKIYNQSTDNASSVPSADTRSNFLYGNKSNDSKQKHILPSAPKSHPFPNSNRRNNDQLPTKSYIKSSNQDELNKISAQMLKAKLSSNDELYKTLQDKLNKMRQEAVVIEEKCNATSGGNVSLIMDAKINKELIGMEQMKQANKDDDIQTLIKKERNQTAMDYNQSIFKNKNMQKLQNQNTDDQFDCVNEQMFDRQTDGKKRKRDAQREENAKHHKKARLISQHKQTTQWLASCQYCVENEEHFLSHLVVFRGEFMYIAVPKQECLVDYECVIVPNSHIKSFREGILLNEQIGASQEEQQRFDKELYAMQKILCKLFKAELGCGCVFVETVRNLKKNYHAVMYIYPLSFEQFNICPIVFKKSILESDVMWTTNKRII